MTVYILVCSIILWGTAQDAGPWTLIGGDAQYGVRDRQMNENIILRQAVPTGDPVPAPPAWCGEPMMMARP